MGRTEKEKDKTTLQTDQRIVETIQNQHRYNQNDWKQESIQYIQLKLHLG